MEAPGDEKRFGGADARAVFLRWERLRPAYNGIVLLAGLPGVWMLGSEAVRSMRGPDALEVVVAVVAIALGVATYALVANVCYLLGPLVECYARWLGARVPWLTAGLFAAGTVFSVLVTLSVDFYILALTSIRHMWDKMD